MKKLVQPALVKMAKEWDEPPFKKNSMGFIEPKEDHVTIQSVVFVGGAEKGLPA